MNISIRRVDSASWNGNYYHEDVDQNVRRGHISKAFGKAIKSKHHDDGWHWPIAIKVGDTEYQCKLWHIPDDLDNGSSYGDTRLEGPLAGLDEATEIAIHRAVRAAIG